MGYIDVRANSGLKASRKTEGVQREEGDSGKKASKGKKAARAAFKPSPPSGKQSPSLQNPNL